MYNNRAVAFAWVWLFGWGRTWFEVIVDDGWSDLVKILEGVDNLHYDGAALLLRHQLVLLQIEVKVVPLTILQNRAEPGTKKGPKQCRIR